MTDRFVPRLRLFYAAQFVLIGMQVPFFPVWLADRGFAPRAIGLILAAPMIVRVPIVPIATRLADRFGAVRGAIVTAAATAMVGYLLAGLVAGSSLLIAAVVAALIAFGMTFPLGDAYALRGLAERGRPYGPVRLWGSAAFIAANVLGGLLLEVMAPGNLIWLLIAACAMTLVMAIRLPPRKAGPRPRGLSANQHAAATPSTVSGATAEPSPRGVPANQRRHGQLWRLPSFVLVTAAASLIQASHAVYYGFSALDWAAKGLDGISVGLLWALGVFCEIVLFALAQRLPAAIGAVELIGLGALGAVIRWTLMALDPPLAALPFLQGLHALSFGATHLGTIQFLTRTVPPRMAATAQGDLAVVLGIVTAGATGLSGALYAAYGDLAYTAMAASAAVGGLFVIALAWTTRGSGRDPPPPCRRKPGEHVPAECERSRYFRTTDTSPPAPGRAA
jgi:MFS transporter, PPP family, 3-phenylpropionic acid transporter